MRFISILLTAVFVNYAHGAWMTSFMVAPPVDAETGSAVPFVQNDGAVDVTANTSESRQNEKHPKPELYSMKVHSTVNTRYATTLISSRVANPANKSQEVTFSIVLPESAFISEFLMEIEGKVYKAYVKKKNEAKEIYDKAVASGVSAGHIAASARDSNNFIVSVNVAPLSKALFNLTYEELLSRRLGVYNLVLNLNPGQIVRDLSVDVDIIEAQKITILRTPALRTGNEIDPDETTENNVYASKEFKNDEKTIAHIRFSPTVGQQKELMQQLHEKTRKNGQEHEKSNEDESLSGQFVVQYDVERDPHGGEIIVYDGYFVHFFAPKALTPIAKHVIFVLDVSGSMLGSKISQLKEAMNSILDDLRPGDYFNLIDFSYEAQVYDLNNITKRQEGSIELSWFSGHQKQKPIKLVPAYPANKDNIVKAKKVVDQLEAYGGTNIDQALKVALQVAQMGVATPDKTDKNDSSDATTQATVDTDKPEPMVIFLTDGDPTVGETSANKILKAVNELNDGGKRTAIFALAFGNDADRAFLKQLAIRNSGFMRHIYEANDAAVQLQQFYKQISSPLLKNITFVYPPDQVEDVTDVDCHILFSGTEFIIAGKLTNKDLLPQSTIRLSDREAAEFTTKVLTTPVTNQSKPSLERLWAYLKIKQLLDQKDAYLDPQEGVVFESSTSTAPTITKVEEIEEKATELALKYSFVTKLTSLVVVKPNATVDVDQEHEPLPIPMQSHFLQTSLVDDTFGIQSYALSAVRPLAAFYTSTSSFYRPNVNKLQATYAQHSNLLINRIDTQVEKLAYEGSDADSIDFFANENTTNSTSSELDKLTWLKIENGTAQINGVSYTLNAPHYTEGMTSFGICNNTVNGTLGTCIAVSDCPGFDLILETEANYLKHACKGMLNNILYLTMCCAEESENSN